MLDQRSVVAMLKAAAEPTRLRILVLLAGGELNVEIAVRGGDDPHIHRDGFLAAHALDGLRLEDKIGRAHV